MVAVIVFRSRIKPHADLQQLGRLGERMLELAASMPGYRSYKDFTAQDGENVSVVEFESLETLARWRDHPEHKAVQDRGRREFFESYVVQVCTLVRESRFPA
jgi:heme-degrading monooxygenase HmoA